MHRFTHALIASLILLSALLFAAPTYGQRGITHQGAKIQIEPTGAITISPKTGQAVSISGTVTNTSQVKATADPANTTNTSASLLVNPATSAANEPLLGVLDNGTSRFIVDKEGDTTTAGNAAITGTLGVTGASTLTGGVTVGAGGTPLLNVLSASASLDFGATAAGACDALTITVTGAADGDTVSLGIPAALAGADTYQNFWGYVSAANTVTVKRCNPINATTPLTDAAAAVVRATVTKF